MKTRLSILLIPATILFSSCAIPLPHTSTRFQGVSGHVFDAHTKRPLSGVHVAVDANPDLATTTDSDGAFSIQPQHNFHMVYVWFIMGDSWPERVYWAPLLNLSHAGYQPLCYNAGFNVDNSLKLPREAKERKGNLTDTNIYLKKR
jgi:hypothetical protein